ncbi:hypothetical protein ACFL4A_03395 [bacterium]
MARIQIKQARSMKHEVKKTHSYANVNAKPKVHIKNERNHLQRGHKGQPVDRGIKRS